MKKDDFDLEILENADNEVIDALNSFPSADEETKRRVFSMSEKKFNDLNNNFEATDENSVKGVETYRRPKWYRTVCVAAAALVLVGGGTATFVALHNTRKSNESMQAASEVETTFDVQEADDKTVTTQLSEVEMKCIYEKLFNPYMAIRRGSDTDRNDPDQEYITFYYYFCDAADYGVSVFKSEDFPCELKEQDGKMYAGLKFYRINNPDFHTIAGMKKVMGQYVSEKFYEKSNCYFECDGISEFDFDNYEDGDVIEDVGNFGEIIQYRDQLYTLMYEPDSFDPENCEVTYEKAFPVNEASFVWECYYHLNDDPENIEVVNALIEMDDSSEWKISKVALGQCSYEIYQAYQGEEYPSLMKDINNDALLYKEQESTSESTEGNTETDTEGLETTTEQVIEENGEVIKLEDIDMSQIAPIPAEPNKSVKDYSYEELNEIAKQLVNIYTDWDTIVESDTVNYTESVDFYKEGSKPDFACDYYSLNDPRFSNLEEFVAYYSPYIDPFIVCAPTDNRNDIQIGDDIDYTKHRWSPIVIEYNGKLYAAPYDTIKFKIISYKISKIQDDCFIVNVGTEALRGMNLELTIGISDEGTFKIIDTNGDLDY